MRSSKAAIIRSALPLLLLVGGPAAAPSHAAAEADQARDWRPAPPPPPPPPPFRLHYRRAEPIGSDRWITADDYPIPAALDDAEGRVGVRYRVRTDGRVEDCTIVSPSGHWALDQATCPLLTARARYRPARDQGGRPMAVTVNQGIRWTLPFEAEPVALAAGTVVVELPRGGRSALTCGKQASVPSLMPLANDLCAALFPEPSGEGGGGAGSTVVATLATGREPPPRAPRPGGTLAASLEVRFDVMADGRVRNCAVAAATGPPPLDLCEILAADPYFEPAEGAAPRPTRMTVAVYTSPR